MNIDYSVAIGVIVGGFMYLVLAHAVNAAINMYRRYKLKRAVIKATAVLEKIANEVKLHKEVTDDTIIN